MLIAQTFPCTSEHSRLPTCEKLLFLFLQIECLSCITMNSPANSQRGRATSAAAGSASDGGYAWFILLSGFLVFGLTFGVVKAFGVFYVEIHRYFETTATGTSWITSIAVATIHVVGNQTPKISTYIFVFP